MRDLRVRNVVLVVGVLVLPSCQSSAPKGRVGTGPEPPQPREAARAANTRDGVARHDKRRQDQPSRRSPRETDPGALDDLIDELTGSQALQGETAVDQARLLVERKAVAAKEARREVAMLQRRKSDAIETAAAFLTGRLNGSVVDVDSILSRLALPKTDQNRRVVLGRISDELALPVNDRTIWRGQIDSAVLNEHRCGVDVVSQEMSTGRIFLHAEEGWSWRVVGFDEDTMRSLGSIVRLDERAARRPDGASRTGERLARSAVPTEAQRIAQSLLDGNLDSVDSAALLDQLGEHDSAESREFLSLLLHEATRPTSGILAPIRGTIQRAFMADDSVLFSVNRADDPPIELEVARNTQGAWRLVGLSDNLRDELERLPLPVPLDKYELGIIALNALLEADTEGITRYVDMNRFLRSAGIPETWWTPGSTTRSAVERILRTKRLAAVADSLLPVRCRRDGHRTTLRLLNPSRGAHVTVDMVDDRIVAVEPIDYLLVRGLIFDRLAKVIDRPVDKAELAEWVSGLTPRLSLDESFPAQGLAAQIGAGVAALFEIEDSGTTRFHRYGEAIVERFYLGAELRALNARFQIAGAEVDATGRWSAVSLVDGGGARAWLLVDMGENGLPVVLGMIQH